MRQMSRAEKEAHEQDARLALELLCGIPHEDADGLTEVEFLSRDTRPTENEGRAALARVLLNGNVPPVILWALAAVFAPRDFRGQSPMQPWNQLRAVLQRLNQGHSNPYRDWDIAYDVDALRREGWSYDDATLSVASSVGRSQEHIKKICGKVKLGFDPPPRARRAPRR